MKFSESLKKSKDFQNVYNKGNSYANRLLVMYVLENHTDKNRLGISVSKKVGNSVIRHHLTRLIREGYRLQEDMFNSGLDIVVIARGTARDASFHQISSALKHPTCSCSGLEAVQKYGAIKGGALAAWRILRCNPFSKGGYDPVP